MSESLKGSEKADKRLKNLKPFKKGQSGNPGGMKKGTVDFISQLKSELKNVEKEKGISLIRHAIQKAYSNPQVLIAMLKKIIPDMSQTDMKVTQEYNEYEKMSTEEIIKEIEQELKQYYKSAVISTEINPN